MSERPTTENDAPCLECERVGLCADCCEDGAFGDPEIHYLLTNARVSPPAEKGQADA